MKTYLLVKALHIICITIWVSGMLRLSYFWSQSKPRLSNEELSDMKRFDNHFTSPAMLFAFLAGLFMAQKVHWWSHSWFLAKFGMAILMAGLHGYLIGKTNKALRDSPKPAQRSSAWPLGLVLTLLCGIVFLVILKPA